MTRDEAILRLRVQHEQAADVLEKFQKDIYGHGGKVGVAIDTAIAALREPKPDSVTITLPNNGMCAIVRKVNGRYEIDTGRVEKWPEADE